jgi:hypothetical protein
MERLTGNGDSVYWQMVGKMKAALDPAHILSPGRYAVMPKPTPSDEKPKNLLEEQQSSFISRFSRPARQPEPVVYEFTNDRALLHQYYRIREVMYRKVFHTDKFVGQEDVHDKISHILIARRGKLCIGGCRLIIRDGDEDFLLPMETPDFKLREVFPNLPLKKVRHGEISRLAILDDDDNKLEVMHSLCRLAVEKSIASGLGYIFVKSAASMARNWRKIGQTSCGLKNVRICTEIEVPENPIHPGVDWYVILGTLPLAEAP